MLIYDETARLRGVGKWPEPDPRELYGDPDLVLGFYPHVMAEELKEAHRQTYGTATKPKPRADGKRPRKPPPFIGDKMVSKKNSLGAVLIKGQPRVIPSKQWVAFSKLAFPLLRGSWQKRGWLPFDALPFRGPVHVVALLTPATREQLLDHAGLVQTVCDTIHTKGKPPGIGIIVDDKQVVSTSGTRILECDRESPRLEIWVRPLDPSIEAIARMAKGPVDEPAPADVEEEQDFDPEDAT